MNPFRSPGARPVEVEVHPDPFPTIACFACERPTTSMNGEALCARCDLRYLRRGLNVTLEGWGRSWFLP